MRIMGPATADRAKAFGKLAAFSPSPLFVDTIAPAVWQAALRYGIDPVGAVAQSAKETGWGKFPGAITAQWRNTCGLKVREDGMVRSLLGTTNFDHALVHAQFGSWETGAAAHMHHLRAYAGCPIVGEPVLSPRYDYVIGKAPLLNFEDLGGVGRWAPASDYGIRLVEIANKLSGA